MDAHSQSREITNNRYIHHVHTFSSLCDHPYSKPRYGLQRVCLYVRLLVRVCRNFRKFKTDGKVARVTSTVSKNMTTFNELCVVVSVLA